MNTIGTNLVAPIDLTGKRVIVTAAGGGIGKVIADSFATRGARVFVCDIDADRLQTGGHDGIVTDMGDPTSVEQFMTIAIKTLGGLDTLVNNAGIAGPTAAAEDIDQSDVGTVLQINLASMFQCVRHAIPALRRSGGGSIINLSSVAGKFGFARRTPYAASKWGVIGLTRSLAVELGPDKIRVNALLPGAVLGERVEAVFKAQATAQGIELKQLIEKQMKDIDLKSFVTPQDVANMALYLSSIYGATITAQAISVDAGVERM